MIFPVDTPAADIASGILKNSFFGHHGHAPS